MLKIVELGAIRIYKKSDTAAGKWKVGLNISYLPESEDTNAV